MPNEPFEFEAGQAGLVEGRDVREAREALGRADGDGFDLARLHGRHRRWRIGDAERDMAADEIVQDRRHAAIGHQRDLGAGHLVDQLGGEVHPRAVAAMADRELAGVALRHRDDVAQRLALERRRRRQDERRAREPRHRHDVLVRVVGHFLSHGEIGAECARPAEPDGVAVGRGLGDRIDPDHGAGTRLVLDHDRLSQLLLQALLDDARHRIRAAARREADDEADRLVGEGSRRWERAHGQGDGDDGGCKSSDVPRHVHFLSRFFVVPTHR